MRPVTPPCSTQAWNGGMYESTISCTGTKASKEVRVHDVPSTVLLSMLFAT